MHFFRHNGCNIHSASLRLLFEVRKKYSTSSSLSRQNYETLRLSRKAKEKTKTISNKMEIIHCFWDQSVTLYPSFIMRRAKTIIGYGGLALVSRALLIWILSKIGDFFGNFDNKVSTLLFTSQTISSNQELLLQQHNEMAIWYLLVWWHIYIFLYIFS